MDKANAATIASQSLPGEVGEAITRPLSHENGTTKEIEGIKPPEENHYLEGKRLAIVMSGMMSSRPWMVALFVGLQAPYRATAVPRLVSDFHALDKIPWIGNGFFLTQATFMLTWGQLLGFIRADILHLVVIVIFEVGSAICGAAPNIQVLILGRAIAGVGASGIMMTLMTIIGHVAKLEDRGPLFGALGIIFAIASICGPLLGGAFTDAKHLGWRWCFYINLPFGAICLPTVFFLLPKVPPSKRPQYTGMTWQDHVKSFDWIGNILALGMTVCLMLPLQWGGNEHPWNSAIVISLFVVSGLLILLFLAWEWYLGPRAILPLHLVGNRSIYGAAILSFCVMCVFVASLFYLPLLYQSRGNSARKSGLDVIPLMLSMVLALFFSATVSKKFGVYKIFLVTAPPLSAIAGGLWLTVNEHTSSAKLIGYQILTGVGVGLCMQTALMAVQAEYAKEPENLAQGTAFVAFIQRLGSFIGLAITAAIFSNRLKANLHSPAATAILTPGVIEEVSQSVPAIFTLSPEQQAVIIPAYARAIAKSLVVLIPASILAMAGGILVRNWNLLERSKDDSPKEKNGIALKDV